MVVRWTDALVLRNRSGRAVYIGRYDSGTAERRENSRHYFFVGMVSKYFFVGMVSKGGKSPVIRIERAISLKQSEVQSCWIGTALKSG